MQILVKSPATLVVGQQYLCTDVEYKNAHSFTGRFKGFEHEHDGIVTLLVFELPEGGETCIDQDFFHTWLVTAALVPKTRYWLELHGKAGAYTYQGRDITDCAFFVSDKGCIRLHASQIPATVKRIIV